MKTLFLHNEFAQSSKNYPLLLTQYFSYVVIDSSSKVLYSEDSRCPPQCVGSWSGSRLLLNPDPIRILYQFFMIFFVQNLYTLHFFLIQNRRCKSFFKPFQMTFRLQEKPQALQRDLQTLNVLIFSSFGDNFGMPGSGSNWTASNPDPKHWYPKSPNIP